MNLIMVPQSWLREKVNSRLRLKKILIGHIYEVKIISIYVMHLCNANNFYFMNMGNKKHFYFKSVDPFPLPTLWDHNKDYFL